MKTRLDKLLVNRGLTASRERAQAMILAGKVLVEEQKIEKAGALVGENAAVRLLGEDLRYVSRGGLKLERALEHWKLDVTGKNCLDIGASTGGFTDCLLQHGADHVTAIDTGYGQIAMKLRQDGRVRLVEKCNARLLTREALGELVDLMVIDVSFISATLVLPPVVASAFPENSAGRFVIVLVKPQFEVGRELVGKGGAARGRGEDSQVCC
jgi:23S rRNA (cytidine1920-2'-O)/16S rRNA (cytidine1409-2'-O)-methyltransferase